MQKTKPSYSQLKADLAAANAEVGQVMDMNEALKKDAEEAYQRGYKDAMAIAAKLAAINQDQAGLLRFYASLVAKTSDAI